MSILSFAGRAVIVALVTPWFTEEEMPTAQACLGIAAWLVAIVGIYLPVLFYKTSG